MNDQNIKTVKNIETKTALKLLCTYADSYNQIQKENKILSLTIKDLKENIKIDKEIIDNFMSQNSVSEMDKKIIENLRKSNQLISSQNANLVKKNISLVKQEAVLNSALNQLKEENEKITTKIFLLEQTIQKKDNIISLLKQRAKKGNFLIIEPNEAVIKLHDELSTYKDVYRKVSKHLKKNCEKINKYENLITDLQTENGKLRTQNKLQIYSANREKENLIYKLREEFLMKSQNTTNNISENQCATPNFRGNKLNLLNANEEKNNISGLSTFTTYRYKPSINELPNKLENEEFVEILRSSGLGIEQFILMSKNKIYSKLTDVIEFLYKLVSEKNMCINLLEEENENLNKNNTMLNEELNTKNKIEEQKRHSQIMIKNLNINNVSNSYKNEAVDKLQMQDVFTIGSVSSSEFNKECKMIQSFASIEEDQNINNIKIK